MVAREQNEMGKMKKKVLVCGSTGFIGRNTAEKLSKNDAYEVYGTYFNSQPLSDNKIKMIKADLTDSEDVTNAINGMDVIIQAAAATSGSKETFTKPYYHVTDNAVINALIFRAAFEKKTPHIIFLSCTTMYKTSDKPIKETDFDANEEIYPEYFGGAWTKVYNEKMCKFYSRIGETKFSVIRHSNIYGPYDKYDLERSHVFGATITKVMTTKSGQAIIVWGEGSEERDLLYVDDLVDCFEATFNKQGTKYELVNVGLGRSVSVKDLVSKVISISGKRLTTEHDLTKPNIPTKICLDITKAKTVFGWEPKTTLAEGINKTIEWYKANYKDKVC